MSSTTDETQQTGRAERQFREAFERLKRNKPQLLPKGAPVSQNNVAKEAGVTPSALRRSRFPALVAEIQRWIEGEGNGGAKESPRQKSLAQRTRNRDLRERIAEAEKRTDLATAKLTLAEARIIELTIENRRLEALLPKPNITQLKRK